MKKIHLLLIVLVVCLSSCNENDSSTHNDVDYKNYVQQMYVVDNGSYNDTELYNKKNINIISSETVRSVRNDVEVKKSINVLNHKFDAVYKETIYYPIGAYKAHSYTVGEGSVLLNEDGSVKSIFGVTIGKLDILPTASPEKVRVLLEPVVVNLIDVSKYEHFDVYEWGSNQNTNHFGRYNFVYYNAIQEYKTDWASVCVSDDGTISRVVIRNLSCDISNLDIDKKNENALISTELSSLYDTDTTHYVSYEQAEQPQIVLYNDELHVMYSLDIEFELLTANQNYNTKSEILIPVKLLVNS